MKFKKDRKRETKRQIIKTSVTFCFLDLIKYVWVCFFVFLYLEMIPFVIMDYDCSPRKQTKIGEYISLSEMTALFPTD